LGAMTILPVWKAIVHHAAIAPLGRPWRVSRIERYHRAANAQFVSAERVVVLSVVALIGQYSPRLKVRGGLPYGGGEVGRVLARAARRDGADDQLRGRVKDGGELRPRRVRRLSPTAAALKVHRRMPRFQARRINGGRRVLAVDQAGGASAVAASSQQFGKPPFSRSFRSTCQSVEWSGILASPSVPCSSAHSRT